MTTRYEATFDTTDEGWFKSPGTNDLAYDGTDGSPNVGSVTRSAAFGPLVPGTYINILSEGCIDFAVTGANVCTARVKITNTGVTSISSSPASAPVVALIVDVSGVGEVTIDTIPSVNLSPGANTGWVVLSGVVGASGDVDQIKIQTFPYSSTVTPYKIGVDTVTLTGTPNTNTFNFSADDIAPSVSQLVTFTASGTAASSYEWDFGDGNTDTGNPATNTYLTEGLYTVSLKVQFAGASCQFVEEKVSYINVGAAPAPPGPPQLWVGVDLSAATPVDLSILTPLMIRRASGDLVLASGAANSVMVVKFAASDYTTEIDITDSHALDAAVTGLDVTDG